MQIIKTAIFTFAAALIVAASVMQFHHHDESGRVCIAMFHSLTHQYHVHCSSETPTPYSNHSDIDCAVKISIVDIVKQQLLPIPHVASCHLYHYTCKIHVHEAIIPDFCGWREQRIDIPILYKDFVPESYKFRGPPMVIC